MSAELIGILSVGAALFVGLIGLGGLTLALWRDVRADIHDIRADVRRLDARLDAMAARLDALTERVARLEGVLEGVLALAGPNGRDRGEERAA